MSDKSDLSDKSDKSDQILQNVRKTFQIVVQRTLHFERPISMTFRRIPSVLFLASGMFVAAAAGATVVAAGSGADLAPVHDAAWDFRDGVSQWRAIACTAEVVRMPLANEHMLRLDVNLPVPAAIEHEINLADMGVDVLSYRVYVPSSAPYGIMGMVYLADKDGVWFQALSDVAPTSSRSDISHTGTAISHTE